MGKRAVSKRVRDEKESGEATGKSVRILKLRLSDAELQAIRVAAAIGNLRPGVFARKVVVAKAQEIEDDYVRRRRDQK